MLRVLLLDDELFLAQAHARWLARVGVQVEVCDAPERALSRICAGERFDVVVCDDQMFGFSGVSFYLHALVAWPELRHRIVFLADGLSQAETSFLTEQGVPIFQKPFLDRSEREAFIAVLHRLGER